jgi:thiosulfate dehydrogenase
VRTLRVCRPRGLILVAAAALAAACAGEIPAAEAGADRFRSPRVSTSPFNAFACSTCHAAIGGAPPVVPGRHDPGFNLAGVTERGAFWGGGEVRLLEAINVCVTYFMGGRVLTAEDDVARQLYEYLASLKGPPGAVGPAPLTIVRTTTALASLAGDPKRGAALYRSACLRCHAEPHEERGRLTPLAGVIPDSTIAAFPMQARHALVEKLRHGRFFKVGGIMPFYAQEVLSDDEVADILAYLGL